MDRAKLNDIITRTAALHVPPPPEPYGCPAEVRDRVRARVAAARSNAERPRWMPASDDWNIHRDKAGKWSAERWGQTVTAATEHELVERLTGTGNATAVYEAAGWRIDQREDGNAGLRPADAERRDVPRAGAEATAVRAEGRQAMTSADKEELSFGLPFLVVVWAVLLWTLLP